MTPTSLRSRLLSRLVPAMLVLLLAGAVAAYWVAWRSATKAYDRALFDTALAVAEQMQEVDGRPELRLTGQALAVLLVDKFDRVFYAVRGDRGELLHGDAELPMPAPPAPRVVVDEGRFYFDAVVAGEPVRVAALERQVAGRRLTVLAAETLVKRNALVREILLGMLLPELLLAAVTVAMVWFGVSAGLRSLADVRSELAGRSQDDLRPLAVPVPEEILPVVTEINALFRRLSEALESQRNFVSDAAHQLRTPIAALRAQIEAAASESPPAARDRFAGILAGAERLSRLVGQLLALARAEPQATAAEPEVALPDVAAEVAEAWLPAAIARGIDLGFELAPASVHGNPVLLHEMLANLLDNAIRHAPEGGTVTVSCGVQEERAWLVVEDDGAGIPEDELATVFERFYQRPGSPAGGCGLGLAIVRAVARRHGGTVSAGRSPRLGGALIRVELPGVRMLATERAAVRPEQG